MDPIADLLIAIKNGYMARKNSLSFPYSKFKLSVVKVLESEKLIDKVEKEQKLIKMGLIYDNGKPRISHVKKISKLGLRVYSKSKNIKSVRGGRGVTIITTPQGVMTGKEARAKKLGGEVICQIW